MTIFVEDEEPFELGTTVSSRIHLKDEDGDITAADIENNEEQVSLEIKLADTDEVIRQEENMDGFDDDNGDRYYLDTWATSEDMETGEYHLVHRATVGGNPYKLTRVIELVEVKDNC